MKVVVFCVPNHISESDLANAMEEMLCSLDCCVGFHVLTDTDSVPKIKGVKSKGRTALEELFKICGTPNTYSSNKEFLAKVREVLLNKGGTINLELANIIADPKSFGKRDQQFLYNNKGSMIIDYCRNFVSLFEDLI